MLLAEDTVAFYRLVVGESARFPEVGQAAYQFGVQHGLITWRNIRRCDGAGRIAAGGGIGRSGAIHRLVCRKYTADVVRPRRRRDRDEVEKQARNAVATFLAAYGDDELSRAART